jgi:hypothetical protein
VLSEFKRFDEALTLYDKAVELRPDLAEAHFAGGLLLGEMELGWRKYEHRFEIKLLRAGKRNFAKPIWLGETNIKDKVILLHAEQGLGDTLLACRYIPMVAALGGQIILEVQPALKSLLQGFTGVSTLIGAGEPIPGFDVYCPMMSLPLAFKRSRPKSHI